MKRMAPLDDLFAQHAGASLDKQWALREIIGDGVWPLDLDAGTIDVDGRYAFSVQFLGTVVTQTTIWRWAWAERPRVIPAPLLACTRRLRRLGQRRQIRELSEPQFDIGSFDAH